MTTKVSIDGVIRDVAEATIPVTDRGFLYGDSVYEVVRTYGGRPFLLREHLERLQRSADQIGLALPGGLDPIAAEVASTVEAAGNAESYVRIIVTRGSGPIVLDPGQADRPRRVVIAAPFYAYPQELYDGGALIRLVVTGRSDCGLLAGAKSGNYLLNVLALGEAKRHGAHEAILLDHRGRVTEGASSNLFAVRAGALETPPLDAGILEGITRRHVVALALAEGLAVRERRLEPGDLREADEIFLTSTLREVLPVTRVMEASGAIFTVGGGAPGPVTRRLHGAYRRAAEAAPETR